MQVDLCSSTRESIHASAMSPTFTLHHKNTDIFARQICGAFFFATPPSFKLSPFSLSPLISYPMPLDDVDGIDEWTAPLLPSDLQIPAVASLALLRTAGCHNNRSRVYDVDDDQCIQRRTNYFNSTAMKPTTWETSESVRPSACLRNVCLSGSSPSKRDCNL